MTHIFISYSKKNSDYAYALADFLQAQGFNIWIDRAGIEYGVSWWDAIVEGLEGCGALIVVMTPEARASDWVQREVLIALQDKKPVFPLLLNGDSWKLFVDRQYADVHDGSMPDTDLLDRLSRHVTPKGRGVNKSSLPAPTSAPPASPAFDIDAAIAQFRAAYRAKNWSEALNVLGRIRASGEDPTPFDPDEFQRRVQAAIEEEENERKRVTYEAERDRQYQRVVVMSDFADGEMVWAALQKLWVNFPNYDPENLARFKPAPNRVPVRDLLPAPFEWVDIPAGKVTLVNTWDDKKEVYLKKNAPQTFNTAAFKIAKYPVTNAQFAAFMKAGGYTTERWWTPQGWQTRQNENWTEPRYWQDQKWNGADYPVVGVSWYEAVAFCRWLSEASGENIMLPTEQQWQRAAQGDDNRAYPWGDKWDETRCNNSDAPHKSNRTTPVRQFEGKGDSPFGVVDMAGNVWEWCLTEYYWGKIDLNGTNVRVLRGSSWGVSDAVSFRAAYRNRNNPHYGSLDGGFRLALSP